MTILNMLTSLNKFNLEYLYIIMATLRILFELLRYNKKFEIFHLYFNKRKKIHRTGLYLSLGYLLTHLFV